jgi:hypothetical protein
MSGGQQRTVRIAASLGGSTPIILGDLVVGLDRNWTQLVTVAIVHAAGSTELSGDIVLEGTNGAVVVSLIGTILKEASGGQLRALWEAVEGLTNMLAFCPRCRLVHRGSGSAKPHERRIPRRRNPVLLEAELSCPGPISIMG